MNVILIDLTKKITQSEVDKMCVWRICQNIDFFSEDPKTVQNYLNKIIDSDFSKNTNVAHINDKAAIDKIDFCPHEDGLVIIDLLNKKIFSINTYCSVGAFHGVEIVSLFNPYYSIAHADKMSYLNSIESLVQNKIYSCNEKYDKLLIDKIDKFKICASKDEKITIFEYAQDELELQEFKLTKKSGWTCINKIGLADDKINLSIIKHLLSYHIILNPHQIDAWYSFCKETENWYNVQISVEFLSKPYIEAQKTNLNKKIKVINAINPKKTKSKI